MDKWLEESVQVRHHLLGHGAALGRRVALVEKLGHDMLHDMLHDIVLSARHIGVSINSFLQLAVAPDLLGGSRLRIRLLRLLRLLRVAQGCKKALDEQRRKYPFEFDLQENMERN